MIETVSAKPEVELPWEAECKRRICTWHRELKGLAENHNLPALKVLKAAVDAQLALAELKLKVRQAGWPKTMTWGPFILPTIGAILGAFIGAWLKHR